MQYDLDWLKKRVEKGAQLNYIFFWREFPSPNGELTESCFSQWWNSPFIFKDTTFKTTEHWLMANKALLFGDQNAYQKIINSNSPRDVKHIGRLVRGFDEKIWDKEKVGIVKNGNYLKFSQHKDLQEFLLNTNDSILVEASPYDKIWGIGLNENDSKAKNPIQWSGLNLLGFALMEVRDLIRNKSQMERE